MEDKRIMFESIYVDKLLELLKELKSNTPNDQIIQIIKKELEKIGHDKDRVRRQR